MNNCLKTTPLNAWHRAEGASMDHFCGFELPLWYKTGIRTEHLSVLTGAGLFDTSHMSCIFLTGIDSRRLIDTCFTRDLTGLSPGRCTWGVFLSDDGHCMDDAIVYALTDTGFLICVNAGKGSLIARHLEKHAGPYDTHIEDLSGQTAKMDLQGIHSARILKKLVRHPDQVFDVMPYFSFKGALKDGIAGRSEVKWLDGTPVLLSRTGYTGEFGFEIFCDPCAAVGIWQDILAAGREFGAIPCGLGARDSLRTGACLPLSGQDIGDWPFIGHPWEFTLPFNRDRSSFTKAFIGARALLAGEAQSHTLPFLGESLNKVIPGPDSQVLDQAGTVVGRILTCVTDVGIARDGSGIVSIVSENWPPDLRIRGLSCGFVRICTKPEPGTVLTLTDKNRSIRATLVNDIRPDRTARNRLARFL